MKRHVKLLSAKGAVRPGSTSALPDRNLLSPAEMSHSLSKSFLFQPNLLLIYIYMSSAAQGARPAAFLFGRVPFSFRLKGDLFMRIAVGRLKNAFVKTGLCIQIPLFVSGVPGKLTSSP